MTHAWVVHGDGLDELTTTGPSRVLALADGSIDGVHGRSSRHSAWPLRRRTTSAAATPRRTPTAIRQVLAGATGPHRDIVLLNAAAGLVVGGAVADLAAGLSAAAESIDGGRRPGGPRRAGSCVAGAHRVNEAIVVRVPASSANLGAGFDVLGMALDLYLDVGFGGPPDGAQPIDRHHPAGGRPCNCQRRRVSAALGADLDPDGSRAGIQRCGTSRGSGAGGDR